MIHRIIDSPQFAIIASTASAIVAEVVQGPLSHFTQCCAAFTGVLIAIHWLRKAVINFLHDREDAKNGKLPPREDS